ncbi:hypothetical protein B4U80_10644 [Leptotrombidium deliense]|uniref:Uncharacterized protein n=1 Tax=Leptotrombidium deliense TaxID=299467 RepID=A0A443QAN5_9ACAR|nr:hypothetical protein B4U80_10644 [Leptotrombidium deliense]
MMTFYPIPLILMLIGPDISQADHRRRVTFETQIISFKLGNSYKSLLNSTTKFQIKK